MTFVVTAVKIKRNHCCERCLRTFYPTIIMEKYKKASTATCEKCVIQSQIIQKYSEEIIDLQRQVSVLSSRLLKYEPDPPVETLCVVKIEDNSDDEFVTDPNAVPDADDDNDYKNVAVEYFSESSREDNADHEYDTEEPNLDENYDSSELDVKEPAGKKSTTRKKRKCKTCDEEFSSSRALLRHNHEVHGKGDIDRTKRTHYVGVDYLV